MGWYERGENRTLNGQSSICFLYSFPVIKSSEWENTLSLNLRAREFRPVRGAAAVAAESIRRIAEEEAVEHWTYILFDPNYLYQIGESVRICRLILGC